MSQAESMETLQEELVRRQAEAEERQNLLNRWMEDVREAQERVQAAEEKRDQTEKAMLQLQQQSGGFEEQLIRVQQENRRLQETLNRMSIERDQALMNQGGLQKQLELMQQQLDGMKAEMNMRLSNRVMRKIRSLGKRG